MTINDEEPVYTFNLAESCNVVICATQALDKQIAKSNDTFHDSGATSHVFHNCHAFFDYNQLTKPINVKGFGSALSAVAVGRGKVKLIGKLSSGSVIQTIITDALHIPTGRCNLLSQTALDKKGVSSRTGNGLIELIYNGQTIIEGAIKNDLYQLHVTPELNADPMTVAINALNDVDQAGFYTA